MQKAKKRLSILLSVLMILSMFPVIPSTAAAAERPTPQLLASEELAVEDSLTESDELSGLRRNKKADFAATGASADLAATGHYNIAVGPNVITDSNYNDVMGDGGSVKYNPSTKVLTLNSPTINGVYHNEATYGAVHIQTDGVTIKGTYHMRSPLSKYGLYVSGAYSVTLDGNFTFYGSGNGIVTNGDVTVKSGSLKAVSTGKGDSDAAVMCASPYEEGEAGYDPAVFTVNSGVTKVTMESNTEAFFGDMLVLNNQRITSPVDASFVESTNGIVLADMSGFAKKVTIEPFTGTYFNVWVGARHVSSQNYNDIFGDGKASYNPSTKTLTLNYPNGTSAIGVYPGFGHSFKIYSEDSLTVNGTFKMLDSELTILPDPEPNNPDTSAALLYCGISSEGALTLNGDFALIAKTFAAYATDDLTVSSGTLTANGTENIALIASTGKLTISDGITKLEAQAGIYPLYAKTGMTFGENLRFSDPKNPTLAYLANQNYYVIGRTDSEDIDVRHVLIEPRTIVPTEPPATDEPVVSYGIALGSTGVTNKNCTDIFGDGKASYNPDTKTLTLNNPTISGTIAYNENTVKIMAAYDLTIKGSYAMSSADADYGILSTGSLTLAGDLTIRGNVCGVMSIADVTVASGTAQIFGAGAGDSAVYAKNVTVSGGTLKATSTGSNSFAVRVGDSGAFTVGDNAVGVELHSTYVGILTPAFTLSSQLSVTSPAKWALADAGSGLKTIVDISSGSAVLAPNVIIERKSPLAPTEPPTTPPTQAPTEPPVTPPTQAPTEPPSVQTYELWIGSTQVTSDNKDDILNDGGKAKYDPDTKTLTLNNPTISGNSYTPGNSSCKIKTTIDGIVFKGSYHMTAVDAYYAIYSRYSLIFDGDFTLRGEKSTIYTDFIITIRSGRFTAVSSSGSAVIYGGWLVIEDDITRVELQGSSRALFIGSGNGETYGENIEVVETDNENLRAAKHIVFAPKGAASGLDLDGRGTAAYPYLIRSTEDWNKVAAYIAAGGATSGIYFKLANAITVTSPLCSGEHPFSGTFDGDGYTLTLNACTAAPFAISGATIRNLRVDGSVNGGRHCSGLVGGISGSGDNRIENCVVAATITTSDAYCGGFVGHGGSTAKTTLSNCIFAGTISGTTCGTFWGWGDNGSTPVLVNCLDLSDSTHPIGRGEPRNASVTNCYYIRDGKNTGGSRPWTNPGKRAYTVTGDGFTPVLDGSQYGLIYNGVIYAAEGEIVSIAVPEKDKLYVADAGALQQNGSKLTLTMPAADVTLALSTYTYYTNYNTVSSAVGYDNEKAENLFDGDTATKWCMPNQDTAVVTFRTGTLVVPKGFLFATANDTATHLTRNPSVWKLEGSADGDNWVTLTDVSGNDTLEAVNETYYAFTLTNPGTAAYSYFRLSIRRPGGATSLQLGELQLIVTDTGTPAPAGHDPSETYDLWLGSTQVTYANRNDILKDGGKAKFDPDTNTLTLNNPTINGSHDYIKIDCGLSKIIVKGSYRMAEDDFSCNIGLYSYYDTTLDGDFTFVGSDSGIYGCAPLGINSGTLKFISQTDEAVYPRGALYIHDEVTRFEAISRDDRAIYTAWFWRGDHTLVTTPENGIIRDHKVYEADNQTLAKHVVIEPMPLVEYNIWLGDTRVTNYNRDDILDDGGKAKFDPETNTLTLDNPTITGSHEFATIYANQTLIFKGVYHMTEATADYGLATMRYTEYYGDFTFMGKDYGVYAGQYSKALSGTLKAVGGDTGYYGWWETTVGRGITRFEAEGGYICYDGNDLLLDEGLIILEPAGGYLRSKTWITQPDGKIAKHTVIVPGYFVSFNLNGHGDNIDAQAVQTGEKLVAPETPRVTGYRFDGWFTDTECTKAYDFDAPVSGAFTLNAKWTLTNCAVTFNTRGVGAAPADQSVPYGACAAAPDDPVSDEYSFNGWYTDRACTQPYDFSAPVESDLTLYARWVKKVYLGDVDGDGKIDIYDASAIQKSIAGMSGFVKYDFLDRTDIRFRVADIDGNGEVNIFDASLIQKAIAGSAEALSFGIGEPIN